MIKKRDTDNDINDEKKRRTMKHDRLSWFVKRGFRSFTGIYWDFNETWSKNRDKQQWKMMKKRETTMKNDEQREKTNNANMMNKTEENKETMMTK